MANATKAGGLTFNLSDIHEDVRTVSGLPTDKKKRQAQIQALRNSLKRVNGVLTERAGTVYVSQSEAGAEAVKAEIAIVREGREPKFKASDIFGS
jgi:hypothetical protein